MAHFQIVNNKLPVALVDNFPESLSDIEIREFLELYEEVIAVSVARGANGSLPPRMVWITTRPGVDLVPRLDGLVLDGCRLRARLMGFICAQTP